MVRELQKPFWMKKSVLGFGIVLKVKVHNLSIMSPLPILPLCPLALT